MEWRPREGEREIECLDSCCTVPGATNVDSTRVPQRGQPEAQRTLKVVGALAAEAARLDKGQQGQQRTLTTGSRSSSTP